MNHCTACRGEIPTDAKFCPWCGFTLKRIGTAEYLSVTGEMQALPMDDAVPLTRIKRVEGKSQKWVKRFGRSVSGNQPRLELVDEPAPAPTEDLQLRKEPESTEAPPVRRVTGPFKVSVNAREDRRFPARVEVGYATEHNFYTGFMENLGSGGLFVATNDCSAIDELVELTFTVPGLSRSITAVCQVQWLREAHPDHPEMVAGMGLRFVKLDPEARAAVELFIKHREPIFFE